MEEEGVVKTSRPDRIVSRKDAYPFLENDEDNIKEGEGKNG